jgi:DNA-binding transcriptional MerR regulator
MACRHGSIATLDNATVTVYILFVADTVRYAIGDLADLASVSRRTVRYYVQEGLLPAPLGLGRGNHYGQEHLDQLLRVKALQEAGRSLDEIKRALGQGVHALHASQAQPEPEPGPPVERAIWRRLNLAPGVELHVAADVRLPPPGKLNDLARWCRLHFHPSLKNEDSDA